jgi:HSP20 family protein
MAEHLLSNPGAVGLQMGCAEHRPNICLSETAAEYVLLAELPGVAEKDLQIQLKKNVLKISGEFHALKTDGQEALVREINHGKFLRAMALPGPVSAKNITAKLNSGILEVRLPKKVRDDDVKVISLANETAVEE